MKRVFACVIFVCAQLTAGWADAVPSADQVLPATTKGYISLPKVSDFRERWRATQLGILSADPVMQPFAEDLQGQIREKLMKNNFHVTLSWEEVAEICGGELCLATIQPNDDEKLHASVLLADITGHHAEAEQVLQKASEELKRKGGERSVREVRGHEVVTYKLPRQRGEVTVDRFIRIMMSDVLILGNDEATCIELLERLLDGRVEGSLSQVIAYQRVMQRMQTAAGDSTPQIRWYLDPFGYAEVMRAARGGPKKRGKDMLAILKSQGFEAIEAVGGWVHLSTGEQDILHRSFVYAPGDSQAAARFQLAARMLAFPTDPQWQWPSWVPRDLATATSFCWNVCDAFENSKTLVDAIAGDEGFFEDLLASIKEDLNGPQIDIRADFVAHLSNRVTVISDYVYPITPQSERLLVAIRVDNEAAVRKTVEAALATDPDASRIEVDGFTVWQIINEAEDDAEPNLDDVSVQGIDLIGEEPVAADDADEEPILPNSAVTVAHGYFFVATHVDFLRRVLADRESDDHLAQGEDVQQVDQQLERIGAGQDSLRSFARTDESYRGTYELIRQGKMPESESIFGRLLNRMLGPDDNEVLREQSIDGSKLPDFQAVRRYLGPSGLYMRSEQDGWYVGGLLLNKQAYHVGESGSSSAETAAVEASRSNR